MTPELLAVATRIAAAAVASEKATGLPAELTAAQCVLESGWLKYAPGNNCFGIKDTDRFPGAQYQFTTEHIGGKDVPLKLAFEVYPSLADCFTDHAKLLTGGFNAARDNCYRPHWEMYLRDRDLRDLVAGISAHYATGVKYAAKVRELIYGTDLTAAISKARNGAA